MLPGGWSRVGGGLGVKPGRSRRGLGISIEDALPPLPRGARYMGRGTQAKGVLVRPRTSRGANGLAGDGNGQPGFPFGKLMLGMVIGIGLGARGGQSANMLGLLASSALIGYGLGKEQDGGAD